MLKEADFYVPEKEGLRCLLCPQRCLIPDSKRGFCRARKNEGNKLYTEVYGKVSSFGTDPIEKKPLYHFYPGSTAFSIATVGCNLACDFCQNYQISQKEVPTREFSPEEIVEMAKDTDGIAFTYNEPIIWYEFVYDTAKLAKENGLYTVMVTNGYINEAPLKKLTGYIDGFNIDVKGSKQFYEKLCHAPFYDVFNSVRTVFENDRHVEVTNLIVPGWNDKKEQIKKICDKLYAISPSIPIHFTRFFPHYKMRDTEPTPIETMEMAEEIANDMGLEYVYLGNVGKPGITYCPACGEPVIRRYGFDLLENTLKDKKCRCGKEIYITL
ncbi:MAG: AmmeMemoRadiSam system radical SAM enzyme [Euryarchaeota archaeon]|nr:AmmeMemoRadiSam system radical SAM enzyme [Euryarchaeota archaeon]